jgi:HTH-type transcriptional regulator / antitoxin HipB
MLLRTPVDLGYAIRDRRRQLNLDQSDLAKQVGVSRKWIIDAEKGKPRAEIGLILRTLDVLGLRLSLQSGQAISGKGMPIADIDEILDRTREQAR